MAADHDLTSRITRRAILGRSARGIGGLALASLLGRDTGDRALAGEPTAASSRWKGVVQPRHFLPQAKRIIWLYMAGGMSHLETFDNKPKERLKNNFGISQIA